MFYANQEGELVFIATTTDKDEDRELEMFYDDLDKLER